ncbi:MAG TPA: amino acid permease [Thermoanaerobaculia bacterium]|nr:amino acid permease [Thermoanaerobaculia bacterium]
MSDSRRIGLWSAAALVVGHTIGVGIFLTPAQLIGALASPALTLALWVVGGLLVLAGAWTYGELAARYPRSGGTYVYLREAFGERAGFLYGWQAMLVMDPGIVAALAVGLAQYAGVLWPAAAGHQRAVALAVIWALALVNMTGLRPSVLVQNLLTAFKLLALAAIVAVALVAGRGSWANLEPFVARRPGAAPLPVALGLGFISVFYSFGGFWEASRVTGEVRDGARTLPRALALGVAIVTIAYVAVTAAFLYLVPIGAAPTAADLARLAGQAMLGPSGPAALSAVVVVSVLGSAMALVLMAPRVYVAMADDGLFPPALGATSPRTGAPVRATALLAVIASLLVLSGSFDQIVAFFLATALVFIGLAAAGLFAARRRSPAPASFAVPGFPATTVLFLLFLAAAVAAMALARPLQVLAGFALVLLGVPAQLVLAPRRRDGAAAKGASR